MGTINMKPEANIVFTLPKAITSVAVKGDKKEVFSTVREWLNKVTDDLNFRDIHLILHVPISLLPTIDRDFINNHLGEYKISGSVQDYATGVKSIELWEFALTLEQVEEKIDIVEKNKNIFTSLDPTIYVHATFRLKNNDDVRTPESNITVVLKKRSCVMPFIVFPYSEGKAFDHFFFQLCTVTPFTLAPKYLRTRNLNSNVLRRLKKHD